MIHFSAVGSNQLSIDTQRHTITHNSGDKGSNRLRRKTKRKKIDRERRDLVTAHAHVRECARWLSRNYTFTCPHMHARTHTHARACTLACMHACTHARTHARTYARTHARTHTHTHTHTRTRTHTHTHSHSHMHTYTLQQTYPGSPSKVTNCETRRAVNRGTTAAREEESTAEQLCHL